MFSSTIIATPQSTAPALDETLLPITVGRRDATPQEMRAIAALNAVLDDQPAPPKTLFDYSGLSGTAIAETRRVRPSANRARVKAITPTIPAPVAAVMPAVMVTPRVSSDDAYSDDYTPAFVAPGFERIPANPASAPVDAVTTTRDEVAAITFEVQDRVAHSTTTVEQVAADVATADPMPFGMATLRLFCC